MIAANSVLESHARLAQALRERRASEEIHRLYRVLVKIIRRDLGHEVDFDESKLRLLVGEHRMGKGPQNEGSVSA